MPDEHQEKPKIIVDDDWKQRVQAEKEAAKSQADQAASEGTADASNDGVQLPPASFATLVHSLTAQALAAMGQLPDQEGKRIVHLDLAKHMIDTLAVVEDKSQGNLSQDEASMLAQVLYELRMMYVSVHKQRSAAGQEQLDNPGPPPGPQIETD